MMMGVYDDVDQLTRSCSRIFALALNALCATLFCSLLLSCFAAGSSPSRDVVIGFLEGVALSKLAPLSL